MSSGGTSVTQVTPPPAQTAGQSAAEYAAALPDIYKAQMEYQPLFDQQTFQSYADLAPQFAAVNQGVLEQFSPNTAALQEQLAKQALNLSQNGLTSDEEQMYYDKFKALVGNQVNAPIGGDFVAKNLLEQDLAQKQFGQNLSLSLQNKAPITTAFQQPSQFQVAPSFGQAFATSTSGNNAFIAGSRPMMTQNSNMMGGIGSILGGVGSFGSFIG